MIFEASYGALGKLELNAETLIQQASATKARSVRLDKAASFACAAPTEHRAVTLKKFAGS